MSQYDGFQYDLVLFHHLCAPDLHVERHGEHGSVQLAVSFVRVFLDNLDILRRNHGHVSYGALKL